MKDKEASSPCWDQLTFLSKWFRNWRE